MKTLQHVLDDQQRVTRWPKDRKQRTLILDYLATKFEIGTIYHEQDVNELLKQWHTYQDWPGLRRELVDRGYLTRNTDGTAYKKL